MGQQLIGIDVVTTSDDDAEVRLSGELDLASADAVSTCLEHLISEGCRQVTVNLSDVTFLDSSGMAVFTVMHRLLEDIGGTFKVSNPRPRIARVFDMAGMSAIVPVITTED
jgi:anti-sigma B factor antagonist